MARRNAHLSERFSSFNPGQTPIAASSQESIPKIWDTPRLTISGLAPPRRLGYEEVKPSTSEIDQWFLHYRPSLAFHCHHLFL